MRARWLMACYVGLCMIATSVVRAGSDLYYNTGSGTSNGQCSRLAPSTTVSTIPEADNVEDVGNYEFHYGTTSSTKLTYHSTMNRNGVITTDPKNYHWESGATSWLFGEGWSGFSVLFKSYSCANHPDLNIWCNANWTRLDLIDGSGTIFLKQYFRIIVPSLSCLTYTRTLTTPYSVAQTSSKTVRLQWQQSAAPTFEICLCKKMKLIYGTSSSSLTRQTTLSCGTTSISLTMPYENTAAEPLWWWNVKLWPDNIDNPDDTTVFTLSSTPSSFCVYKAPSSAVITLSEKVIGVDQLLTIGWTINDWGWACGKSSAQRSVQLTITCDSTQQTIVTKDVTSVSSWNLTSMLDYGVAESDKQCNVQIKSTWATSTTTTATFTTCKNTAPSTPQLTSPADGSIVVTPSNGSELVWSLASWGQICGQQPTTSSNTFEVFLGVSSNPTTSLAASVVADNVTLPFGLMPGSWYYWRVNAISTQTAVVSSSAVSKFYLCQPRPPSQPVLIVSSSGGVIGVEFDSTAVVLSWLVSDWGESCLWSINRQTTITITAPVSSTQPIIIKTNQTSSVTTPSLTDTGNYTYTVTASNGRSETTSESGWFAICKQINPSKPIITSTVTSFSGSVAVKWTHDSFGVSCSIEHHQQQYYKVILNSTNTTITSAPTTLTEFTYQPLTTGSWTARIVAVNSPLTVESSLAGFDVCIVSAPDPVTNVIYSITDKTTVNINWSPPLNWGEACTEIDDNSVEIHGGTSPTQLNVMATVMQGQTPTTSITVPASGIWYFTVKTDNGESKTATPLKVLAINTACVIVPMTSAKLASPTNQQQIIDQQVTFQWTNGFFGESCRENAASWIDLFVDGNKVNTVPLSVSTAAMTVKVSDGQHNWQVKQSNGNMSVVSELRKFKLCVPVTPTGAPKLLKPANNSIVISPVTLEWDGSSITWNKGCGQTPNHYDIAVSSLADRITTNSSIQRTTVELKEGQVSWTVVASHDGLSGPSSVVWRFNVCQPQEAWPVTLLHPNGYETVSAPILFQWQLPTDLGTNCQPNNKNSKLVIMLPNNKNITVAHSNTTSTVIQAKDLVGLSSGVTYQWSMAYFNGYLWTVSTQEVLHFCVASAPSKTLLSSPLNGTVGGVVGGNPVVLKWSTPSFGESCLTSSTPFNLTITVTNLLSSKIIIKQEPPTATTTTIEGLNDATGSYKWWVTLNNGRSTTTSAVSIFTICHESLPTGISILHPLNGTSSKSFEVEVSWKVANWGVVCFGGQDAHTKTIEVFVNLVGEEPVRQALIDVTKTTQATSKAAIGLWPGRFELFIVGHHGSLSVSTLPITFTVELSPIIIPVDPPTASSSSSSTPNTTTEIITNGQNDNSNTTPVVVATVVGVLVIIIILCILATVIIFAVVVHKKSASESVPTLSQLGMLGSTAANPSSMMSRVDVSCDVVGSVEFMPLSAMSVQFVPANSNSVDSSLNSADSSWIVPPPMNPPPPSNILDPQASASVSDLAMMSAGSASGLISQPQVSASGLPLSPLALMDNGMMMMPSNQFSGLPLNSNSIGPLSPNISIEHASQ